MVAETVLMPGVTVEELSRTRGILRVEPLERTLGHTLGNALRRMLLEFIPGAAATHVRIRGATHEFTTLEGVVEDVLTLCQRLKRVRFAVHGDGEYVLRLQAEGEGPVTASRFQCPPEVEVANPDFELCTLVSGGSLELELYVRRGRGYVPRDEQEDRGIGYIALDSIYSPILDARYEVTGTRVGRDYEYESLSVYIETDGTIRPREAFLHAASLLERLFGHMRDGRSAASAHEEPRGTDDRWDRVDISALGFSPRTFNALRKAGISTVGQLLRLSERELASLRSVGEKTLEEIKAKLKEHGLSPRAA